MCHEWNNRKTTTGAAKVLGHVRQLKRSPSSMKSGTLGPDVPTYLP